MSQELETLYRFFNAGAAARAQALHLTSTRESFVLREYLDHQLYAECKSLDEVEAKLEERRADQSERMVRPAGTGRRPPTGGGVAGWLEEPRLPGLLSAALVEPPHLPLCSLVLGVAGVALSPDALRKVSPPRKNSCIISVKSGACASSTFGSRSGRLGQNAPSWLAWPLGPLAQPLKSISKASIA